MPDPGDDPRPAGDAAEQAVAAGDLVSAANHLRATLARQEAELGLANPDLASTLNNLGVVHERMGDIAAAERCYRRAYAMVTAAFPAGHPFVETSRQNLAAFCKARGIPLEPVAPPERAAPPLRTEEPPAQATNGKKRWGRLLIVSIIAVVAVAAVWTARRERHDRAATSPPANVLTQTPPVPAASPAPPAATPPQSVPPSPTPARPTTPDRDPSLSVVDAKLCTELSRSGQWTCAPATDPVSPGTLYFFTRIASARDATVVHRWYRDESLQMSSELQIRANMNAGYRTYSRLTIDPGRSGQWRVEIQTTDGKVLHEARFTVR
jgi:hypothetical protein